MIITILYIKPRKLNYLNKFVSYLGLKLPVAVFEHIPMVTYFNESKTEVKYKGVEIEIVMTLGKAMNFKPKFYESPNSQQERWGRQLANGSYTGLIGQLVSNVYLKYL